MIPLTFDTYNTDSLLRSTAVTSLARELLDPDDIAFDTGMLSRAISDDGVPEISGETCEGIDSK